MSIIELLQEISGIITVFLGVMCFCCGRFTVAKKDAKADEGRLARMETTLEQVSKDVAELKTDIKGSVARLHQRLDDHLRFEHGQNLPRREE